MMSNQSTARKNFCPDCLVEYEEGETERCPKCDKTVDELFSYYILMGWP
jgi:hypothetical protein